MHRGEIDRAAGAFLSAVVTRPERAPRVFANVVLIGFDVTVRSSGRALLSFQLAGRRLDGSVCVEVFYPDEQRLTSDRFLPTVADFVNRLGRVPPSVRRKRRIWLVAHRAAQELGMFSDPLRDWRISQIGKAHHADLVSDKIEDRVVWSASLIDLSAYYKADLTEISTMVGRPKPEVTPELLETLFATDREAYERYVVRDAEIELKAFEQLRETTINEWAIDVLACKTLPSVASSIFRHHFLKAPPVPIKKGIGSATRKVRGEWRPRFRTYRTFDGSSEVRLTACLCYWGARTEAFVRGLVVGPVVERDVVSLYPSAALLQPLPDARTRWRKVSTVEQVASMEGFGIFDFEFPPDCEYPCLLVTREGGARMAFPLKGQSQCTFSEVRVALNLGARIVVRDAWGFEPTGRECDHDLAAYIRHFLAAKAAAEKGSLAYETCKLLLNALIGKFAERDRGSFLLEMEHAARRLDAPGVGALLAQSPALRNVVKKPTVPGKLWAPEWGTLIHGRARAIMASIVARGVFLVSTDAVFVRPDTDLKSEGLTALRSIGSDLEKKVEGDALFVARSRQYAVLQRADNVRPDAEVFASDSRWAVVRVARHGTVESRSEFAETVLACLAARKDAAPQRRKTRVLSAEAAVRQARAINDEVVEERTTSFNWDSKRRLVDRDVNIFTSSTRTKPYATLGKLEAAEHLREVRAGTARRKRRGYSEKTVARARVLLEEGISIREIARRTKMPKSTVFEMKRRYLNETAFTNSDKPGVGRGGS